MAKKDGKIKNTAEKKSASSDPRFSSIHSDPRFRIPGSKQLKTDLDSRFKSAIAADERFKKVVSVDRYGRKVESNDEKKQMENYYNMESSDEEVSAEEEEVSAEEDVQGSQSEESGDSEDGEDGEGSEESDESEESDGSSDLADAKLLPGPDYARGEGLSADSDDSDSESSDSESEPEAEQEELLIEPSADAIPLGDETSTFAVVNMDWDNLRAVDLMMTFSSFAPKSSKVLSVTIYPSEFGKKMMAIEEQHGPSAEFFDVIDEDDDEPITDKTIIKEDAGEEIDSKQFRKYQLQRLRYYYAIVKCDSVATAKAIYDQCDGTEFESTANFFDLRYVPDDMEFEDEPKDVSDNIPTSFKPNSFVTDALQHSKVKLTWDETPADRQKLTTKAFNQKDIEDMDFKAYLASDSESDAEAGGAEKYRQLLGSNPFGLKTKSGAAEKDEADMEITFTPGLDEEKSAAVDKGEADEEHETTLQKYKRKEKERKKKRMEKFKTSKQTPEAKDDGAEQRGETKETKEKGKPRKKSFRDEDEDSDRARKDAELELLLIDDDLSTSKSNGLQSEAASKKQKGSDRHKTKSRLRREKLEEAEADFDIADSRFQALFDNPEYSIDTTLPQFKKTKAMENILKERRRRTQLENGYEAPSESGKPSKKRKLEDQSTSDKKSAVTSLVEKLKSRSRK